ncbi:MAG TPA: magnesium transporter [Candidatus Limihabitans stercoravium]|nr:magnesium transporter [Candidatus Limihabitans stercoravium]
MDQDIRNLLEEKKYAEIQKLLKDIKPQDIALMLEEMSDAEIPIVFRLLPKEIAADTFVEMSPDSQKLLINCFTDAELKAVLDDMFLDDTVDVIEEMPANVVKRILNQTDPQSRKWINEVLKYPKDSAGTLMTMEYVNLKKDWTVKQSFDRIRKTAVDKETIYTCYVTDGTRKLIGRVSLRTMMLNSYETVIGDIMETNVISVDTDADKEFVASQFSKYDLNAIPVVDKENRIVGIITVDDAMDVMEDEATEDISMMAAVTPSDTPYLDQSVWRIWLNRVPWLMLLMISATFTGLIINTYEATLSSLSPLLFACIPMLMDTGGNAGSQTSVTIIRGLALDEIHFKDLFKVVWKEIRVSVLLALSLSVVCFGKLLLIDNLIFGYDYTVKLSALIAVALLFTVVIAKVVGCMLPLLAKKVKLDPAVVASPFITTIVDALSLIIYCNISVAVLA